MLSWRQTQTEELLLSLVLAGVFQGVINSITKKFACPYPDCPGFLEEITRHHGEDIDHHDGLDGLKRQIEVVCSINGEFHHWSAVSRKAVVKSFNREKKIPIGKLRIRANSERIYYGQVISKEAWAARQPKPKPVLKAGKPVRHRFRFWKLKLQ